MERRLLFIRFRVFKCLWLVQLPAGGTLFKHGVVLVICFFFLFLGNTCVSFLKYFFDIENVIIFFSLFLELGYIAYAKI